VGGFGFKSAARSLAFDRTWLERSSKGMSGKCELVGWHGEIVKCTERVPPGGGTITARAAALSVSSPTGGIQARRSVCRFIIDVKDGDKSMPHTFVGFLTMTATPTPRANVQALGGWMLDVQDGAVSSSVGATVCGPRPAVMPGGAIEMVIDYDSQNCFIAVYTPDAVAAGYPQPPQSVSLLEFAGKAFPVYGALNPAVSLYMDGVSVRVEEPSAGAAIATVRAPVGFPGPAPRGSFVGGNFGATGTPVVTTTQQPHSWAAPFAPTATTSQAVPTAHIFSPPASVKFKFGLPVEPPVDGFGFKSARRAFAFDPAWLERSSEGTSGKCDISGWSREIVTCTKRTSPNGGSITTRTVNPLAVFSSTSVGGIQVRHRSVCRFIINVKGSESMQHAFVGLLPGTAKAAPRANPQDLGGWMLHVEDGHVSSSVRVTVSGARPRVVPGGAIEMVMDYDSQKCHIAVYTPAAVAAGFPQPPWSVTQLEFAGRPFPADGTLYPAVSLCMDGVSVNVEEPSASAAVS
jgi:hypothetical protein